MCSKECRKEQQRRRYREANPLSEKDTGRSNLLSGTVGAMHELIVCADLMRKGFEVFRAVSPSSRFDAVVFKDGNMFRLEVTTGSAYAGGKIHYPVKDKNRFDILAIVVWSGEILYEPGIDNFM